MRNPSLRYGFAAYVAISVAFGCAAIRPAAIVEQYNSNATATAVRLAVERFHEGLRERNIETILNSFIADTTFRAYDGDEGWLTFDNLRLQDAAAFRRLRSVAIHLDSMSIAVLDPSAAVVSSNLHEAFTDSAGHELRLRVTQTTVWTRRAEGWRIAHVHSSERPDSTR
ncbi:MAG TPA: nuclear transport factor 2 family protein [Gemmatimonadaceae bacterium]|nr:nuclear transport factor 2 family protein [Gemmatimonadaceae bacterium]